MRLRLLHAGLATIDAMSEVDAVYSVGPLMQNLHKALPLGHAGKWFETSTDAAAALTQDLAPGDILLVKGSNYMQLVRVVDALREMGQGS